jgi:hypothetical protein
VTKSRSASTMCTARMGTVGCRALVFQWIQEVRRGNEELRNEGRPGRSCRDEVDAAMRLILQDEPTVSLRTMAETLAISPETVRPYVARIRETLKAFGWSPHTMISELRRQKNDSVPVATSQAPCAAPHQLAPSHYQGRELELVVLRISSQSDIDGEGRECTGSGEQNHCDEEKHADC